jgi:Replication-relaxation
VTEPFTSGRQLDLLTSIYQHRLITTGQLHRLNAPGRSIRATHHQLHRLVEAGLVAAHQPSARTSARWYATDAGAELAERTQARSRPYRMRPAVAAGSIAAHTIAVNEVGCLLAEAARERGEAFGSLDWEHEIAHPYRRPASIGTGHLVIADAVLYYTATRDDGTQVSLVRFLELDRGTASVEILLRKVRRYAHMHDYAPHGTPLWREHYSAFPRLNIVLDGLPVPRLDRRLRILTDLCRDEPDLVEHADVLGATITKLDDLRCVGPFGPVFHPLIPHPEFGDQPLTLLRRPITQPRRDYA